MASGLNFAKLLVSAPPFRCVGGTRLGRHIEVEDDRTGAGSELLWIGPAARRKGLQGLPRSEWSLS